MARTASSGKAILHIYRLLLSNRVIVVVFSEPQVGAAGLISAHCCLSQDPVPAFILVVGNFT